MGTGVLKDTMSQNLGPLPTSLGLKDHESRNVAFNIYILIENNFKILLKLGEEPGGA